MNPYLKHCISILPLFFCFGVVSQEISPGEKIWERARLYEDKNIDSAITLTIESLKILHEEEKFFRIVQANHDLIRYHDFKEQYEISDSIAEINWPLAERHLSPKDSTEAEVYWAVFEAIANKYHYNYEYISLVKLFEKTPVEIADEKHFQVERLIEYYTSIGRGYRLLGDHQEAIRYYRKIIYENEKLGLTNPLKLSDQYFNIGKAYFYLQKMDSALKYYSKAESYIPDEEKSLYESDQLYIFREKARVFSDLNEVDSAFAYAKKAIALISDDISQGQIAFTYTVFGACNTLLGNWQDAEKYLQKSLSLNNKSPESYSLQREIYAIQSLGELYQRKGDYGKAANYFEQVIILNNARDSLFSFDKKDYTNNYQTLSALIRKIQCSRFMNPPEKKSTIFSEIQLAQDLIQELRNSFRAEESKLGLAKLAHELYEESLLFWDQLDNKENYLSQAFEYIESNKAMLLYAALQDQEAQASLPDRLRERERRFKRDIAYYEKELFDHPEDEAIQSLLFSSQQFYQHFIDSLEQDYPRYFRDKYRTQLTSMEALQAQLQDKQAFIQYFVGDSNLFVLGVHSQGQVFYKIAHSDSLHQGMMGYIQALSNGEQIESREMGNNLVEEANYLYNQLLQPLFQDLPRDISSLIISPDNILNFLPFEALLTTAATPGWIFPELPYLIRDYAISYTHSATLWITQQEERPQQASNGWLGFAPTFEEEQLEKEIQPLAFNSLITRDGSVQLPFARQEVSQISSIFSGRGIVEMKAVESQFYKLAPSHNILHLATHGIVEDRNPMYSKLVFAPENDTTYDGFLHANEIYNMQLPANLVVLSACNTGIGKMEKGEGIMSLSRAFFHAGVKSILMSLWSVSDAGTSELMVEFYKEIKKEKTKDIALQQAKLSYLSKQEMALKGHPYFWAGFVLKGNTEPISMGTFFTPSKILGILIFILGLLGGYFLLRRVRSS